MPATLTSLLIFVVLLLPGLAYVSIRERNTPRQHLSVFRETVTVVTASILADLAALLAVVTATLVWPDATPDIRRLILGDTGYVAESYLLVFGWATGLLAAATVAAGIVGAVRRRIHTSVMSSWWAMFEAQDSAAKALKASRKRRTPIQVGCVLDDQSFITGRLWTYSQEEDETADRDVVLREPILYRPAGVDDLTEYPAGSACISAARIVVMFVNHLPDEYSDDERFIASVAEEAEAPEGASEVEPPPDADPASRSSSQEPGQDALVSVHQYAWTRRSPFQVDHAPGSCQRSPGHPPRIVPLADEPRS